MVNNTNIWALTNKVYEGITREHKVHMDMSIHEDYITYIFSRDGLDPPQFEYSRKNICGVRLCTKALVTGEVGVDELYEYIKREFYKYF